MVACFSLHSMHRFLGYDTRSLPYQWIYFVADLGLLLLLFFVWKPLALLLIYVELFVRIIILSFLSLVYSLLDFTPPKLVRKLIAFPYQVVVSNLIGTTFIQKLQSIPVPSKKVQINKTLWDCVLCVSSLSLLLRFLSGLPSTTELRKHPRLVRVSLFYRIFRHMI